jgi:predicted Zn-dependent peptidase
MKLNNTVYELPNKLKAIVTNIPGRTSTLIQVFVKTGYANEYTDRKQYGHAHFVEHMLFKGTKKRSQKDLNTEADILGGSFNAYTSREHTTYYIQIHGNKVAEGMDLLSDMVFNATFASKEIEKEKSVIVEEFKSRNDQPEVLLYDLWDSNNFNNSMGHSPIGDEVTINESSRKSLLNYYKKHYRPDNMIVTITGNTDKISKELIMKYFGKYKNEGSYTKIPFSQINPNATGKTVHKDIEQIHFYLSYPGLRALGMGKETIEVVDYILGEGMSSRLFQTVREEKGYCYSIYTQNINMEESGSYAVGCSCSPEHTYDAIKTILKEVKEVGLGKVSKKELTKAKEKFLTKTQLAMERPSFISGYNAESLIYGNVIPDINKTIEVANTVTEKDIKSLLSERIWKNTTPTLYVVGNLQSINMNKIKSLLKS